MPRAEVISGVIAPLDASLVDIARNHRNGKEARAVSFAALNETVATRNVSYEELVLSL